MIFLGLKELWKPTKQNPMNNIQYFLNHRYSLSLLFMLVTSKINNVWSVNIIDRGVRVMMVMALSPEACSAHAVITMTLF